MDTNMTFRMDSDVKAEMAAICAKLGMTMSTAFNIFVKDSYARAAGWLCQVKCVINFLGIGLQRIYRLEGGA